MSKLKKLSLIALVLVIVGVVGCLLTFQQLKQTEPISKEKMITKTFSSVQIDSRNASVEILPTTDLAAKAVLTGQLAKNKDIIFNTSVEGDQLKVELKDKRLNFFNLDFFIQKLTLKVYLPEKDYQSVTIQNNNGKMQLADITTSKLVAKTNNGHIEVNNVESKNVEVRTDNGRITLNNVTGKLKGKTNNGKIFVSTKSLDRPMDLSCDNGRIEVVTEKDPANVRFDVHVDNGRINILDKYRNNAVIGNGDNLIKLSTDNGSITITK